MGEPRSRGARPALRDLWAIARQAPIGHTTVRALLSHAAGLPTSLRLYRDCRSADELRAAVARTNLVLTPGDAVYSDVGFIALGEALRASGRDLTNTAHDEGLTFGPVAPAAATEDCTWRGYEVVGLVHDENAFALGGVAGHAGAFGRLPDVAAGARRWLNADVLAPEWHREATQPQSAGEGGSRFGSGWWLPPTRGIGGTRAGLGSYGATGFTGTRLWVETERGYAVVVLTNRVHPRRSPVTAFRHWFSDLLDTVGAVFEPVSGGEWRWRRTVRTDERPDERSMGCPPPYRPHRLYARVGDAAGVERPGSRPAGRTATGPRRRGGSTGRRPL